MDGSNNHCFSLCFTHADSLTDNLKGCLRRIRAHQQLRQEESFLFKAMTDKIKRRNHILVNDIQRLFAFQSLGCCLTRRSLQSFDNGIVKTNFAYCCCCSLRCICIMLHVFLAALVIACQRTITVISIHHRLALRIDDAAGKTCCHRHAEEGAVDSITAGKTEGNIGNTHNSVNTTRLHCADNLTGNRRVIGTGGNSQCQRVHNYIAAFNAVFSRAGNNFFSHGNTSCCSSGNTAVVKAQRNQYSAVFFCQRQHMLQAVLLAVDGIKHRLAVIKAQCFFHCFVIRCINLQRGIGNRLQRRHSLCGHCRFVNARSSNVNVQNLRAYANLLQTEAAHIIKVTVDQCFLQTLFACRIDAFADNYRTFAKMHCLAVGGYRCQTAVTRTSGLQSFAFGNHLRNMLRRCTAAAADDACAIACQLVHQLRIFLRADIKASFAVTLHRQSGIRIDNQRQAGCRQHLREQLTNLHRSQTAVKADGIYAQAFAHQSGSLNSSTGQKLTVLIKGHGHANRQITVFLRRQNRSFDFIGVAHRFDKNQIRTGSSAVTYHFAVGFYCLFKGQIAIRSQQLACRSQIQRNKFIFPATAGLLGNRHSRFDGFLAIQAGACQLQRISAESIGFYDIGAYIKITAMHSLYNIGVCKIPAFGQLTRLQTACLQLCASGTIKEQHLLA